MHIGWNGRDRAVLGGLRLPGGCTATTGYKQGCGMRAHFDLGVGGPVTVATATSGLHVKIKDKTTGTKLASGTLNGSLTTTLPASHEYSLYLFPDNGSVVGSMSLSLTWP